MKTTPRCLIKALPSYKSQLTPAVRAALVIQHRSKLTPVPYSIGAAPGTVQWHSTTLPFAMADSPRSATSPSTAAAAPAASSRIHVSANQPADLPLRAAQLFPTWDLTPSGKGLRRQFVFTTFNRAWQFMDTVAQECKAQRHHPEWSNLYNRVTVEWTTHRPEGLSVKDVHMAEFCDRVAAEIGLKSQ